MTTMQQNMAIGTTADEQRAEWRLLPALIALAVLAVTVERAWLGFDLPLWIDETWTAVIATQPDWASFWREAWLDCNAPLYYAVERIWVLFAGTSNVALRLPSAIFLYAAATLPLLWTAHGLSRRAALVWSALMLLWWPGIMISLDARAYGLLLLLSTAGLIAFIQAYRAANRRLLLLWSTLCALQLLTHYFAVFLVAAQGLMLLYKWRLELVRRFLAFMPLLVPVAWGLYHLPRLRDYARPDVAWYPPTDLESAVNTAMFTFGPPSMLFPAVLLLGLAGALWKSGWKLNPASVAPLDRDRAPALSTAAAAGALALGGLLAATVVVPSLAVRYLVPLVPSMLLAVVLLVGRIPRAAVAYVLLVLIYAIFALTPTRLAKELETRAFYGYERPSAFLAEARPTDLVFVWDHPAAKILAPASLEQIGGFFLRRAGNPVRTQALVLTERDDPNAAIRSAVRNPRTAILWLYNAHHRSAAETFPPMLADDSEWECLDWRNYRKNKLKQDRKTLEAGMIACVPRGKGGAR